jgi:hypothetical protein
MSEIFVKFRITNAKFCSRKCFKRQFDPEDQYLDHICRDLFCSSFDAGQNIYTNLSSIVNGFPVINGNKRKIEEILTNPNFDAKGRGQDQKSKRTFCSFFDARHNIYTSLSSADNTFRVITINGNAITLK